MFLEIYREWLRKDMLRNYGEYTINASVYIPSLLNFKLVTTTDKEKVESVPTTEEKNIILFYQILPSKGEDGLYAMIHALQQERQKLLADWLAEIAERKGFPMDESKWKTKYNAFYPDEDRARDLDSERKRNSIWFHVRSKISSFTGRRSELDDLHNMIKMQIVDGNNSQMPTVVTGLGGVGKTQLIACYVAENDKDDYYNAVWINSENLEGLSDSFYRLAEYELKIETKSDGKQKDIKAVVKDVYKWFQGKLCLFVFDNAEQLHTNENGQVFPLLPLRDDEAWDFIKGTLKIVNDAQEESVKALANTLQNLPLALQQAVAYINTTNEDIMHLDPEHNFMIEDYLKLYETNEAVVLLKYRFPNDDDNFYLKPTFTTWHTTVDKLENMNTEASHFAIHLLNICAFCAPNKIPVQLMFLKLAKNNKNVLGGSVGLLKQYSLVTVDGGYMSVHKVVQEVIRIVINEQGQTKDVVCCLFEALHENVSHGGGSSETKVQEQLLAHISKACDMIQKKGKASSIRNDFGRNKTDQMEMEINCLIPLIKDLFYCYYNAGNIKQRKQVSERLLALQELHFGPEYMQLSKTLLQLGEAYFLLGDFLQSKEVLERSLAILEQHQCFDNFHAHTLVSLASVYYGLGQPQKQKELAEKALAVTEKRYGPDHIEVAKILTYSATMYGNFFNVEKQKEHVEKALALLQKHYGSDHFRITLTNSENVHCDSFEIALTTEDDDVSAAEIFMNLANNCGQLGNHTKKRELLEIAVAIKEKFDGPDHTETACTIAELAKAYGDLGDSQNQTKLLERALAILEINYGPTHFLVAKTLSDLGIVYGDLGDTDKKMEFLARALAIKMDHYGDNHYELTNILVELAKTYCQLGDHSTEKTLLERAAEIEQTHFGIGHFATSAIKLSLGVAWAHLENHRKAAMLCEGQLAILEKYCGPEIHIPDLDKPFLEIAMVYGNLGEYNKQKELLEKALAIQEKDHGPMNFHLSGTLMELAKVYSKLGNLPMMEKLLERTMEIQENHYGSEHLNMAVVLLVFSKVCFDLGNSQYQAHLLERALKIYEKHYGLTILK